MTQIRASPKSTGVAVEVLSVYCLKKIIPRRMENKPSTNHQFQIIDPNATGFQFSLGNFSFGQIKPVPKKENYDLQKLETIRETLKCMICGKFPRPNNMMFFEDLFRCSKCFHLMCQACQQLQAQTQTQPGPNRCRAPAKIGALQQSQPQPNEIQAKLVGLPTDFFF